MKRHIEITSAAALGIMLLLTAGAAGAGSEMPAVGRFQIACTDSHCFLVDTVTGQVWSSSQNTSVFRAPKIEISSTAATDETNLYLGQWARPQDPAGQRWSLYIRPGGRAAALESEREHVGTWTMVDDHIIIDIDDEAIAAQVLPDGRLMLWDRNGDGTVEIMLTRVPGTSQSQKAMPASAPAGFMGQWTCTDPDEGITIRIEPGGRALGIEDDGEMHAGRWRIEGMRIFMEFDDEEGIVGELISDTLMSLWQEDDPEERLVFRRTASEQQRSAIVESGAARFLGQWIAENPDEEDLGLQLEPGGLAIATADERSYAGQWRLEGSRLFLTVDDEEHVGQLLSDGRLLLREDGDDDEALIFRRPLTESKIQSMTMAAAEAGFLGRWLCDDPEEADLALRIEPGGVAIATERDDRYVGSWTLEGSRLAVHVDNDEFHAEMMPDGRLGIWEDEDDERITFRRPQTVTQRRAMTVVAGERGFMGSWTCTRPEDEDLGLRIEPDGVAIATGGGDRYEGSWSLDGSRLTVRVNNDEFIGEMTEDGRLVIQEKDGDERYVFQRSAR